MLQTRTWALLLAAAVLVAAGALNFAQRLKHQPPATDGIQWQQAGDAVVAQSVTPGLAGSRAQILPGDRLIAIGFTEVKFEQIERALDVQIYLEQAGPGGELHYLIERPSFPVETRFYYADLFHLDQVPSSTTRDFYINFVGLVYLFVGLFVLFKQTERAPFVLHFASLCLAAFVFHFYKPTGAYEDLDLAITFLDRAALVLFPPLFLHFCLLYPARRRLSERRAHLAGLAGLLYAPALMLLILAAIDCFAPSSVLLPEALTTRLYDLELGHFWVALALSAGVLVHRFVRSETAVVRQQLKWIVWGSLLAVVPFAIISALTYLEQLEIINFSTTAESWLQNVVVLPLVLIPLTFGNSVVRYRLMDVDMVVRRVAVYTLTTLTIGLLIGVVVVYVAGLYATGVVGAAGPNLVTLRVVIAVIAMTVIVMLAAPLKNFLQERTDRLFYGERYDLRHSLVDFGRMLSATTALEPLLDAIVSQLQQVLGVERIAIFIEDDRAASGYRVARAAAVSKEIMLPPDFREMVRVRSAVDGVVRADDLDLEDGSTTGFVRRAFHYYVPCVVRGRMIAVIGMGRSAGGALLSSEDTQILRAVSGYIAVAIENSLLYQEQSTRAAELELLKEFNESIVESISTGLLAVDMNGRVTRCNSALEEMLNAHRDKIVNQHVEDLFAEDFAETLSQVLDGNGWRLAATRHIYKLHTATRDGRSLVLNLALAPLRQANTSQHTGALVVLEDTTARTRMEEQLQQRDKLSSIGLLAAGVAHEINTPLTGVSSYTQMLLGTLPETDPKHALLQKIRQQTDRAARIVGNLLNFSRTGSQADFGELDLNRVLDDTLQLLEPQLRRNQIEIERLYDDHLPKTFGNAGKLQQVFTNLIMNARDAIPAGGRIRLRTATEDDTSVYVEVADTGIGIRPQDIARIYDPFFTTKGVGQGTGLGLAVTYGIVQEHSGHIGVESVPGKGTTFRITLPTVYARPQLQAASD